MTDLTNIKLETPLLVASGTLARWLNVAPKTLDRFLRNQAIQPDGVLMTGESKGPSLLYDTEKVPHFKELLSKPQPKAA